MPQLVTDAAGTLVMDRVATPFGEVMPALSSVAEAEALPLRFPGQRGDAESALSQNWHRDYDPRLGRYVQSDPIGLAGGLSTYGYANQNPLIYIDPTGEIAPLAAIALGAGMAWAIDFGFQMYEQRQCENFTYDWGRGAIATGSGALGGGAGWAFARGAFGGAGLTAAAPYVAQGAMTGAVSGATAAGSGDLGGQLRQGGDIDWGQVSRAARNGGAAGAFGGAAGGAYTGRAVERVFGSQGRAIFGNRTPGEVGGAAVGDTLGGVGLGTVGGSATGSGGE